MEILSWVNFVGLVGGICCIIFAQTKRTEERPVWYKAAIFAPFGWKRSWWTPGGYRLQVIGAVALYVGLVAGLFYYWGPWA